MSERFWSEIDDRIAELERELAETRSRFAGWLWEYRRLSHQWQADNQEIVRLSNKVDELESQGEWEPVGGGFNSGRLGRFEIQVGITDDRTMHVFNVNQNRKCWPVVLPETIRLCRRKEGR